MPVQDIIGYLGGTFIMVSFVPQVIKSYRTKSVKDLSLWMIIATVMGTIFWEIYAFVIWNKPLMIMNGLFGFVVLYQLFLKMKYEK